MTIWLIMIPVIYLGHPASIPHWHRALVDAVWRLRKAFGAPGDYGYETDKGRALFALYRAANDAQSSLVERAP